MCTPGRRFATLLACAAAAGMVAAQSFGNTSKVELCELRCTQVFPEEIDQAGVEEDRRSAKAAEARQYEDARAANETIQLAEAIASRKREEDERALREAQELRDVVAAEDKRAEKEEMELRAAMDLLTSKEEQRAKEEAAELRRVQEALGQSIDELANAEDRRAAEEAREVQALRDDLEALRREMYAGFATSKTMSRPRGTRATAPNTAQTTRKPTRGYGPHMGRP